MVNLHDVGRLPAPEDNCAIATRLLPEGTVILTPNDQYSLNYTLLEGHRFAVQPITAGEALLSWCMPFGRALRDIKPGEYVINQRVLDELRSRSLDFVLPSEPNFSDDINPFQFDEQNFRPAEPLPRIFDPVTFKGYRRAGNRGVGTRNMIVLLGVNALVAGFVKQLENEMKLLLKPYKNVDGIVAVTHTEGSQKGNNNEELLLRTLAGYMVHPNVAAVLAFDVGDIGVTNRMLQDYAEANGYLLDDVFHRFTSLQGSYSEDIHRAGLIINEWLPEVNQMQRTDQPLGELKIALQCGGSDAFSGISGNPLVALVSKSIIQAGGSALLAETDELIGAESYVLDKVRDVETAQKFLAVVDRFQERVAWHGYSAQGNPSGGNRYRGLYNIYLKSLGAATKRHPDVPLDFVLDYSERMNESGYYFMDSPGNDLESIAGQVASGCNLIFFVTGNGSITNFPFVPTIKVVTTSERYKLLPAEMDVNAGAYLDGTPLEHLGKEMMDLTVAVASGQHSAGEKARHSQVQIWRNWQQTRQVDLQKIKDRPAPDGLPIPIIPPAETFDLTYEGWRMDDRVASERIGLILPSSLCSGQIASMAARQLNDGAIGREKQISRFVPLVHTEGCGSPVLPEFVDPLLGYLSHPSVVTALFLEHGCEMTHNDFWRGRLLKAGLNPNRVGWASVQLDGGMMKVMQKMKAWFSAECVRLPDPQIVTAGLGDLQLGIMSDETVDAQTAESIAMLGQQIVSQGGTVILPENDPLIPNQAFTKTLTGKTTISSTLSYGRAPHKPGFHVMANPSSSRLETMTGLGATGVGLILGAVNTHIQQGHPFIPTLLVTADSTGQQPFLPDIDILLTGSAKKRLRQIMALLTDTLSRKTEPKLTRLNITGFQITRGEIGVSF